MLCKISSAQLTEWMADYKLEPWGDELLKWYLIQQTAATYNADRKTPIEAIKFALDFCPDRSAEAMAERALAGLAALTRRMGGEVVK